MKQMTSKTKTASRNDDKQGMGANGNGRGSQGAQADKAQAGKKQASKGQSPAANNEEGPIEKSLLGKFFLDQLQDIYYAENKIAKALPKMEEAATTEELKEAFNDHLHQTQKHIKRLEKVFQTINKKAEGKVCEAIEGITKEADTIIGETTEGSMTRDAALIIAAQKVEHYEIATYGGLVQLAITMGLHDAADLLDTTLMEEEDTDALLTDIAETSVNIEAEEEGSRPWQQEDVEEAAIQ